MTSRTRPLPVLALLVLVVPLVLGGLPDTARAAIGQADSAPFALNTDWAAGTGVPAVADRLADCVPNPFNPHTTIRYELAGPTTVTLRVYDLQGRLVRELVNETARAGGHFAANWDGRDDRGRMAAAGVYLCRMVTDRTVAVDRMTLVK